MIKNNLIVDRQTSIATLNRIIGLELNYLLCPYLQTQLTDPTYYRIRSKWNYDEEVCYSDCYLLFDRKTKFSILIRGYVKYNTSQSMNASICIHRLERPDIDLNQVEITGTILDIILIAEKGAKIDNESVSLKSIKIILGGGNVLTFQPITIEQHEPDIWITITTINEYLDFRSTTCEKFEFISCLENYN